MTELTISASIFGSEQISRYTTELQNGAEVLDLSLDADKIASFIEYLALFHKWNKSYNLSAIRNPDEMPAKHILDSLSILPYIKGKRIADIGTGAGLPGVPLAICLPQSTFCLLDANGKKTRFLFQVKQSLNLSNIEIMNTRVENWQAEQKFDALLCRAYSSIPGIVESCSHLLASDGKIFAMKGLIPRDELREVEKSYIVDAIHKLNVPGVAGQRNLIVLARRN